MPPPHWIPENRLNRHIEQLLLSTANAREHAQARIQRNVVDPFSSLIAATTFDILDSHVLDDIKLMESALRGLSNAIGQFHQVVLGSIPGWNNHDAGYDLECRKRRILAEVKNKHNTMNAANKREVEADLRTALRQKQGRWTGYLVHIIPRDTHRHRREIDLNLNLFEVDGASFYEIATGDANAIHDLFDYLLERIEPSDEIAIYCLDMMDRSLPPREVDD